MTQSKKHMWLAVSAIVVAIIGILVADHFAAEARLKKIAEHTGEIYEKQMERLQKEE